MQNANYVEVKLNDSNASGFSFDTVTTTDLGAAQHDPKDYIRVISKVLAGLELDDEDKLDLSDLINYLVDQLEKIEPVPGLPFQPLQPIPYYPYPWWQVFPQEYTVPQPYQDPFHITLCNIGLNRT